MSIYNDVFPEVKLRAMEPEDLDLLYSIENDMVLWNVGTTNVPYSRYVLHDYIANSSCDIYADRQLRLIIENSDGSCRSCEFRPSTSKGGSWYRD